MLFQLIKLLDGKPEHEWMPAFAGMTEKEACRGLIRDDLR